MTSFVLSDKERNIYLTEIIFQADIVLQSAESIDRVFKEKDEKSFWLYAYILIISSAHISQLLFPTGLPIKNVNKEDQYRVERGFFLCKLLGVTSDSILKKRNLRNDLEHFDERIDKWAKKSNIRSYVGRMMGSLKKVRGLSPKDVMRQYIPESGDMAFMGEVFNLADLISEIGVLREKVITIK